ncbi:multidrug resistance-associated ABC transporter [Ephemerocybe angulata]|uniref:Multidrug resistance-associated ABC transporter n=1 Tax=Ephemerocybe angulata TaxID=980116 RepID=A0A8H6IFZ9_9AGAR|nr:multidrug resistance-associated ABC transporter [Tulosesus angulatus]
MSSFLFLAFRGAAHYAFNYFRERGGEGMVLSVRSPHGFIERNGGPVTASFFIARVLGSLALVGLSVPPILIAYGSQAPGLHKDLQWYGSMLLANVCTYAYRDLWPLATYDKQPLDISEGWLLWLRIGVLSLTGFIIPVCIPHIYAPADPKYPAEKPHPEQTASWLSFHTYSYLSPTIMAATKVAHLSPAELPPLPDYDRAHYLSERAFPGHHLFFGLMQVFGMEFFKSVVAVTVYPIALFAAPLAVNRLLTNLEHGGGATVRPWVWVLSMFIAPVIGSFAFQAYAFVMTRALVDAESILTQLVFDYALKIRIQADVDEEPSKNPSSGEAPQQGSAEVSSPGERDGEQARHQAKLKPKTTASFIGKLNNLVTIDMKNIINARNLALLFWFTPFQVIGSSIFLYILLGWSFFVGLAFMVVLLPVPGYLSGVLQSMQKEKMKKVILMDCPAVNVLRMIKMFGWEQKIQERIDQRRDEELAVVWKYVIPTITMLAAYATATIVMKMKLTAATVFSSMILFDTLRNELYKMSSSMLTEFTRGKVSLDRMNAFFKETDLLDAFVEEYSDAETVVPPTSQSLDDGAIGFCDAAFTWSPEQTAGTSTPNSQFRLSVPGKLEFLKGKINLIVGATGSGKTSMLMALLGEMHFSPISADSDSAFNLPRTGGVSFAVQESWVLNETVRENILFHSPYEDERYKKVLHQCALEQDLEMFEAGDLTEVGERGLTLSGGQKARLTLARAIYSKAEIILLDDILAALDVHTQCFKGDLIEGRTILLATHNIALASPVAEFIVSVGTDGVATSRGKDIDAILASEPTLKGEFQQDVEAKVEGEERAIGASASHKDKKAQGKLILSEEIKEGSVSWEALKLLVKSLGGNHVMLFLAVWVASTAFQYIMISFNLWFLGHWSSQYETHPAEEVEVGRYLGTYVALTIILLAGFAGRDIWFMLGKMRASRTIHRLLVESILGTTFRWLDETPVSRIIARLTMDIDTVQGLALQMIVALVSAVMFGYGLGSMYLKAQLSVKRELSNAKAPMLAHFEAAMAGLVSLRAYGLRAWSFDLNRWINFRIDVLGAAFTASANVGFSLNRSVRFASGILWLVRVFNMFQVEANSSSVADHTSSALNGLQQYTEIEQEPKPTERGKPPAAWPTSGELRAEHLTSRYSKTGPAVLHDLNFNIRAGERVGVVGRTGSGKSSLTLSLLRCILTEGSIYFDGLPTNEINLDSLRSNITVIPQMPELLSDITLTPFEEYDDPTLNAALRSCGLYAARNRRQGRTVDRGSNVSVGQRQLIALARAIANHETDNIIQHTLRGELGSDVTVMTIAHRLQTIIDADRIMVLDAGHIAEFASPAELLAKPKGLFKALVDESGDKVHLYEVAERKVKPSTSEAI